MKPIRNMRSLRIIIVCGYFFISLLLLFMTIYLSSCKALGKTGVVAASIIFLLLGVILTAGMVVVIKIALRSRKKKMDSSDRVHLILWGILLPVLFSFNIIIGLPYLQDCLEGKEITQQFIVQAIYMNSGRSGTVLVTSPADAKWNETSLYHDVNGSDSSVIYFHSGMLANITFMKEFFDVAGLNGIKRDQYVSTANTQTMYATITYYPRTHAILAYKDVKIIPAEPTAMLSSNHGFNVAGTLIAQLEPTAMLFQTHRTNSNIL